MLAVVAAPALKPQDGKGHLVGFAAYFEAHAVRFDREGRHVAGAPVGSVNGATARRRGAVCAMLGISGDEYDRRAEAFVARLLARHPALAADGAARRLALSFASHAALAQAQALAGVAPPAEGPAPAAPESTPAAASVAATLAPSAGPRPAPQAAPRLGPRKVAPRPARLELRAVGAPANDVAPAARSAEGAWGRRLAVECPL